MLPPLGLMALGSIPGSPVVATANDETPSGQFADNLLSLAQATVSSSAPLRDLDHKPVDAEHNVNGLNALPVTSDLVTDDSAPSGSNVAMPLEDYALMPVDPIKNSNAPLPLVLPPNGNSLPVTPQAAQTELHRAIASVDGSQRLDDTVPSAVVGRLAIGPDELGLGLRAVDIARAVQNYGEFVKPSVDAVNSSVNRATTAPAIERSNLNTPASLLPNSIPTASTASLEPSSQAGLNPFAASTSELANSLLAGRAATTSTLGSQLETAAAQTLSGQTLSGVAGQVRQALVNQNGPLANVGATTGNVPTTVESAAKLSAELTPLVSANASNSAASPQLAGSSRELPGLSSQLLASGAGSVLMDRAGQVARNAGNLTTSVGRNDGLATLAGNPIEVVSAGLGTTTASSQLRTALAGMDPRQLSTSSENAALATASAPTVPAESADAITPAPPASVVARSTSGAGLLPSGLMPMAASARLDVADGTGGQWVGRLSQMIAQQQLTGQSLRIALSPAELGSVELTFSGSADNWAVSLNAQQGQTRELLESHLDRIRSMLQDLGVSDAQVAMADRWTGQEASSGQHSSDPSKSRSEQNAGWQHSPSVQSTATDSVKNQQAPSSGVDAYV